MSKYAYSYDQEEYHGEFDTRGDALAEAISDGDSDGPHAVWTGEIVEGQELLRTGSKAYFLAERSIEQADEMLADEIAADDYIIEVTDAQKEELGRVIVEWLCTHAGFCRWGVKNVQEHSDEDEEPQP